MSLSAWRKVKVSDFIKFNPKEILEKKYVGKKIGMDKLAPFTRKIEGFEIAKFSGGSKFRNGDTLVARISPCLENGKTAQVSILDRNEVGFGSTEYIVLRKKDGLSDENYIYYFAISPYFRNTAIKSMSGTSGRQRVQQSELENIVVSIPNLSEQRSIAATLSCLDDKIEVNAKINHNLEEMAQTIFKSWFIDFEPWNGERPTNWFQGRLGDYVDVRRGGSPRPIQAYLSETGFRWLKISDVTRLETPFVLRIKEHIKKSGLKKTVFLKAGSLVLSNSATPGIPKILCVDTCVHDGWLYFPTSIFSNEFLYLLFKHIRQDLLSLGNGSIFTNLKTDILKNYMILVPEKSVLFRFNKLVLPLFQAMEKSTREMAMLEDIRNVLLPKLMSGEIRVPTEKTVG
ncbi:restriction endonuclease subunit S [Sporolactobacillus sp. CQH2019]|uniref:restriction endonuclease subunit S n=1 Tax=Sporolactobacillus sp. CQH2019 TaxID=3023512 RepID=UPI002367B6C4|nr:restriction endonuclease subunit S [Sporolactobacillus sp. CQH2019]MDD9149834.1 restriction endonuclease subunit S [Sporolactobacillus sp. CQH2019]